MCPQKWKASACCARRAAATKPVPLTARSKRPARARKPRRDVLSATVSLSTDWTGRVGEQAFELEERVEGSLREHVAVRREDDRVRTSRDREVAPGRRLGLLVEELELDLRVRGDQPQRRLERRAERAPRGGEDGDRQRRGPLETLDQVEPRPELRAFVFQRQRRLRSHGHPQLAELPRQREHGHREAGDGDERDREADSEPRVRRRVSVREEGQRRERPCERGGDRKSTRLNSSHVEISYAVFCLKKKKKT